jgi:hypothetical protein
VERLHALEKGICVWVEMDYKEGGGENWIGIGTTTTILHPSFLIISVCVSNLSPSLLFHIYISQGLVFKFVCAFALYSPVYLISSSSILLHLLFSSDFSSFLLPQIYRPHTSIALKITYSFRKDCCSHNAYVTDFETLLIIL